MGLLIRFVLMLTLVVGTLVACAVVIGHTLESDALTETLFIEDREYVLSIRDSLGGMTIPLVGTDCHDAPPPDLLDGKDSGEEYGASPRYALVRDDPVDALARVLCP